VATLPEDLTVRTAAVEGATLVVDWSDGHRSTFDVENLMALADAGQGRRPALTPPRRFDATHRPTRFDFGELEPGSVDHHDLLDTVATEGMTLVENLPDSDDATEALARLLGHVRDTDFGRIFNIVTEPEAWTLSQSNVGQDPHSDDPYRYTPSGFTILHCRRAATGGGESILVDGFKVADDIRRSDPEAFELLASVSIPYVRHRATAVDQGEDVHMIAYAPVITINADGEVMGIRFHERSTGVFDLDPAVVDRYYLAFRAFAAAVRSPANQFVHKLVDGQAIMVDNQRALHGRTDFGDDVEGRRHLRLCSIDRDQVHSRLRRLKEIHALGPADQRLPSGAGSA
ncbi:MAG: TauD/TfdA family dioxygenase, partial [Acidimicrobiia bacterium]|nr:TauD/TfdA family dioxygenase [Acidimicrobiia bacterium]